MREVSLNSYLFFLAIDTTDMFIIVFSYNRVEHGLIPVILVKIIHARLGAIKFIVLLKFHEIKWHPYLYFNHIVQNGFSFVLRIPTLTNLVRSIQHTNWL